MGAGELLDEFRKVGNKGKVALLLGKGVEGVSKRVLVEVGQYVVYCLGKWWQRRKKLSYGEVINGFLFPSSSSLLSPIDNWILGAKFLTISLHKRFMACWKYFCSRNQINLETSLLQF